VVTLLVAPLSELVPLLAVVPLLLEPVPLSLELVPSSLEVVPSLEPDPELEPVPEPELAALALEVVAAALRARAGSWPVASTTAISNHAATNSATDPLMIRRRIERTRLARAALIAFARACLALGEPPSLRPSPAAPPPEDGASGVMFDPRFRFEVASTVSSVHAPRRNRVRNR
jgi:hypothetical protein